MKSLIILSLLLIVVIGYLSLSDREKERLQVKSKDYMHSAGNTLEEVLEDAKMGKEWITSKKEEVAELSAAGLTGMEIVYYMIKGSK